MAATPQNLRAYQFKGESLDGGPGNVRTINWPPAGFVPTTATASPYIQTIAFVLSDITPFVNALSSCPITGERMIKNQNPFWYTFTAKGASATSSAGTGVDPYTFTFAIPPMGIMFLPDNIAYPGGTDNVLTITCGLTTDGNQPAPASTQYNYFDL